MIDERFSRSEMLFGEEAMERLYHARVAVFGVGGVGGYVVEALARGGIGQLDLIDNDTVCLSNINRQIIATQKSVGQYKVDVAKERILDINPSAIVRTFRTFYTPETAGDFDFREYDYVVDAIDTVSGKLELVMQAKAAGVPIISCMGAGNKLNPAGFEVADLSKTSVCPLAKVMRRELKKRGIEHLKVVYSKEPALTPLTERKGQADAVSTEELNKGTQSEETGEVQSPRRRQMPGSNSFVPGAAGLIIAGEVIKDLSRCQAEK